MPKTLNCKHLKKTKDPKCNDQEDCNWIINKGCMNKKKSSEKVKSKTINCKQFKKTKDPKCNDQDGCNWITNKRCVPESDSHIKSLNDKQTKLSKKKVKISYDPSLNKKLKSMKTISKEKSIFKKNECKENQIAVKIKDKRKCMNWTSAKVKNLMLKNLSSKKKPIASNIVAPKQMHSNCWFNSFFMIFFISDKGRKFMRFFREAMITGKFLNGKEIPNKLKFPLFYLNKSIEASLIGKEDPSNYFYLYDTNRIIVEIYKNIPQNVRPKQIKNRNEYGNPYKYYNALIKYLLGNHIHDSLNPIEVNIELISNNYGNGYEIKTKNIKGKLYEKNVTLHSNYKFSTPDILMLKYDDDHRIILSEKIKYKNTQTKKTHTYKLDSAVLRNTERHHFTSYITLNGESYTFEGIHDSPLEKYDWKKDININKNLPIGNYHRHFNFMIGYQLLLYYRVD